MLICMVQDPTSSPGPSPRSKWRSEKPLAKAAEILQESWSILSRDTRWNGFFGGCFQCMAALFVFWNRKLLFKRKEDISWCLRDEILTNFWSHFGSLGQGFLRPPFWTRRRPWGRGCVPGSSPELPPYWKARRPWGRGCWRSMFYLLDQDNQSWNIRLFLVTLFHKGGLGHSLKWL